MRQTYKNLRVRPCFQREFLHWFLMNRRRFSVYPRILRRSDHHIDLVFTGITQVIFATVTADELAVGVKRKGRFFDLLVDFDIAPQRMAAGYVCEYCYPEAREVYSTMAAMRQAELFEPFLAWVNDELAQAKWVRLFSLGNDGSTGATLIFTDHEKNQVDPGMQLLTQLKSPSGEPIFRMDEEMLQIWLISLRNKEPEEAYLAKL